MKEWTVEGRKNERSPGVQAALDRVLKTLEQD
jgi:hypothetical protein